MLICYLYGYLQRRRDSSKEKTKLVNTELELEKKAAWLAIRCAAATGQAQRSRMMLIGDPTVTTLQFSTKSLDHIPEFIPLDLISSYVLGEKKKIYKSKAQCSDRYTYNKCNIWLHLLLVFYCFWLKNLLKTEYQQQSYFKNMPIYILFFLRMIVVGI